MSEVARAELAVRAVADESPYVGGGQAVDRVVERFYGLVFGDRDLRPYFRGGVDDLRWYQAAELTAGLGGLDLYRADGLRVVYVPQVAPAEMVHRAAFYLVRAVDQANLSAREAVTSVATALAAGGCRIVGGHPVTLSPAVVLPVLVTPEVEW